MKDKQNQINEAFEDMSVPPLDKQAKKRAINLALAEFDGQQSAEKEKNRKSFQGFWQWLRPTWESTTQTWRSFMKVFNKTINNRVVYSALGSVCVAAVCFSVLYPMMERDIKSNIVFNEELGSDYADLRAEADRPAKPEVLATVPESLPVKQDRDYAKKESLSREGIASNNAPTSSAPEEAAQLESLFVTGIRVPIAEERRAEAKRKQRVHKSIDQLGELADADIKGRAIVAIESEEVVATPGYREKGRDKFEDFEVNPIKRVSEEPVSTFSVDVDTSSYSFVRRQLNSGRLPQKDAVRIEEMINYFDYNYDVPESRKQPFKPSVYVMPSPWNKGRQLIHIGIKGYEMKAEKTPASNLVFLLDVSGSMNSPDKLPLVKQSMGLLLDTLNPDDTISMVVYAGAAGTVLEPTKVKEKQTILSALNRLQAGGSTAGAQGIKLAYQLAEANFDENAINRVILATDGDFNVGITDNNQLQDFIERKRDKGIFLSVLGFGQGNYQDHRMQTMAQNGNGVAAYIDTLSEAQKVLVNEATSMLFPIAKDVKIQVEFNPETISEYRLIGYETRHLEREDFNNDKVDAGDIGAGHTVTAIYEVTPVKAKNQSIDESRYQQAEKTEKADHSGEYAFLKIRYKLPDEDKSKLITQPIEYSPLLKQKANKDIQFATAVTAFAQILKGGKYMGGYNYDDVIELAQSNKGADEFGYRTEFIQLVRKAKIADDM